MENHGTVLQSPSHDSAAEKCAVWHLPLRCQWPLNSLPPQITHAKLATLSSLPEVVAISEDGSYLTFLIFCRAPAGFNKICKYAGLWPLPFSIVEAVSHSLSTTSLRVESQARGVITFRQPRSSVNQQGHFHPTR